MASIRTKLIATFAIGILICTLAFIQTPEFVVNFKPLAQTSFVQTLAPRTENFLKLQNFFREAKAFSGKPDADANMFKLLEKTFNLDATFTVNHQGLNTAYKTLLAGCLLDGSASPKNPKLALELINSIDDIPQTIILPLANGLIENRETTEGIALMERAIRMGNPKAGTLLGSYYMNGKHGLPLDWPRAYKYFLKAADDGEPLAALNIAFMTLQGRVPGAPPEYFITYLEKSLSIKPEKAAALIQAWAYAEGWGYAKDKDRAKQLEIKADTYPSTIHCDVTDFFNQEGWGQNPAITQNLLLRSFKAGILNLSTQREAFFTSAGPTKLYIALEESLRRSAENQADVTAFLKAFSNALIPQGKTN